MSITGVGIDLVSIDTMKAALLSDRFIENTFSSLEQEYCNTFKESVTHFAGTFAAKEAVRKAKGLYLKMNEIEIRRNEEGKPEIWAQGKQDLSLHISITHTNEAACAIAIAR